MCLDYFHALPTTAVSWNDMELTCALGEEAIINVTGINPHQMYLPSTSCAGSRKISRRFSARRARPSSLEDFIVHMLTGECAVDLPPSRTMAFDIRNKVCGRTCLPLPASTAPSSVPVPAEPSSARSRRPLAEELGLCGSRWSWARRIRFARRSARACSVGMAVDGSGSGMHHPAVRRPHHQQDGPAEGLRLRSLRH